MIQQAYWAITDVQKQSTCKQQSYITNPDKNKTKKKSTDIAFDEIFVEELHKQNHR